jgi:heptosyltransferase-2
MDKIKICIVYTHRKIGDLIWQLPYIKAISEHHKVNIDLIVRKQTQAKNIFKDLSHINTIYYNEFRKGLSYWIDVFKLFKIFKKKKYNYLYILDKVNKPAIAARLANIKNIIAPGIGNQKFWITSKYFLEESDKKLNYSKQSQKLLKINEIEVNNLIPNLVYNSNVNFNNEIKKIAFGVDSSENYKMWYEDFFVELAKKLYKKKVFDVAYLICGPDKKYISNNIISYSNENYFIDCANKDLQGIIETIKQCSIFIGNNAGPLNLSSALGVKTFGLIANDPVSELTYSRIIPITPENYIDNVWNRDRAGMKKLTVEKVFNEVMKNLL